MTNERLSIMSEINELESLIALIPTENVIDKKSAESRLRKVQKELEQLPPDEQTQKVQLTFRGVPVDASRGIFAGFAARVVHAFSKMYVAVAAGMNGALKSVGKIPKADLNQLMITGVALGSFGFEFELPEVEESLFPEWNSPTNVMNKIETLFSASLLDTDDDLAEAIDEISPRGMGNVRNFLYILKTNEAWCGIEHSGGKFRFDSHEQVKKTCEKLDKNNIKKEKESYSGEFIGVLPEGRKFEFKLADRVLAGKISPNIEPEVLNRDWLNKPASIDVNSLVVGHGKPRYTLLSYAELSNNESKQP